MSFDCPDAPYIRDAEMNGVPCQEPVHCPHCGAECKTIYTEDGDVIGCDKCIKSHDVWDWIEDNL